MQSDQIIRSLRVQWGQNGTNAALIPVSSIYAGRNIEGTVFPYVELSVNLIADEILTCTNILSTYGVAVKIYSSNLIGNAGTLQRKFNDFISALTTLTFISGQFIHTIPVQSSLSVDPDTNLGKDIVVTESLWHFLINEIK